MNTIQINFLVLQEFFAKLAGMLLIILLARFLGVSQFGAYQQVYLVITIFVALFAGGVPMAMSFFYGRYRLYSERVGLIKRFYILTLAIGLFSASLYAGLANQFSKIFRNEYFLEFSAISTALLFLLHVSSFYRNFSLLTLNTRWYFYVSSSILLGMLALHMLNLMLLGSVGFIFGVQVAGYLAIFFLMQIKTHKYLRMRTKRVMPEYHEIRYLIPIAGIGLVGFVNELVDQVMVSAMLSPRDLAHLKVGSFKIPFISILTISVTSALVPKFSKYILEERVELIAKMWKSATSKITILVLPVFVFAFVFSSEIMLLLFSEKYTLSSQVFRIYTAKYFLTVVTFGMVMASLGLQKEWLLNLLIVIFLNIILNYFAIQYYGILGAAYTSAAIWYVGAFLQIKKINHKLSCNFRDYFPIQKYLRVLLTSTVYVVVTKYMFSFFGFSNIFVIPFALIYYVLVLLTLDLRIFSNFEKYLEV